MRRLGSRLWAMWGLGLMFLTAVASADNPKPFFKEEHFHGNLADMERVNFNENQHRVHTRHAILGKDVTESVIWVVYESDDEENPNSLSIDIRYYPREGDAQAMFDHVVAMRDLRDHQRKLRDMGGIRVIGMNSGARVVQNMVFVEQDGTHRANRLIRRGNYFIHIMAMGTEFSSDERFAAIVNLAENYAYSAIRAAGGELDRDTVSVTLAHVHPFAEKIPPGRVPGDIVATVTDKRGKPLAGRQVVFTVDDEDGRAPVFALETPYAWQEAPDMRPYLPPLVDREVWAAARTDENGRAVINYLAGPSTLCYGNLAERLKKYGNVWRTLRVVVLEGLLGEAAGESKRPPLVDGTATTQVEYTCIARIVSAASMNTGEKPEPTVFVARVADRDYGLHRVPKDVSKLSPYELQKDDIVRLQRHDAVTLQWLNGLNMRAHPKITWLKDHEFGSITICPENAGWWRAQSPTVHDHRTSAGVGLVGVAIGAKWTLLGTIYGVISVGFYTVWGEIESWTEPLIIEVHSEIILDPGEKLTFYTLEGEAMLRRVGQENGVTLPAGKMLAVRGEGDLGPPTDFSRSELPDELEVLAREVEAAEPNYELSGTAASASSSGARRKDDGLSAGAIVAIVLGALLVAGGLGAYVVLLIRRSLRP